MSIFKRLAILIFLGAWAVAPVSAQRRGANDASRNAAGGAGAPRSLTAAVNPASSSGGGKFQVRVLSNLDNQRASALQATLRQDGYGSISKVEKDGKFAIVVGPFSSREEANGALAELKQQDYSPEAVEDASSPEGTSTGRTVSTAEAGKLYRVLVYEFPKSPDPQKAKDLADSNKKALLEDDYANVSVVDDTESYKVFLGSFAGDDEAKKMAESLVKDGYSLSKVVATKEATPAPPVADEGGKPAPKSVAAAPAEPVELPAELKARLSPAEQATAQRIIAQRQKEIGGTATADEIIELRQSVKQLGQQVKEVVQVVTTNEEDKREKAKKINAIYSDYRAAMNQRNWDVAEQKLTEVQQVDPAEASLEYKRELLNRMRAGTMNQPTAEMQKDSKQKADTARGEALKAELRKDYETARTRWYDVLALDPNNAEAKNKTIELTKLVEAAHQPAGGASGGGSLFGPGPNQKYVIGGVAGVLAILVAIVVILIRNSKRERELMKQVQELTLHGGETWAAGNPMAAGHAPAVGDAFGPTMALPQVEAAPGESSKAKKKKDKGKAAATSPLAAPSLATEGSTASGRLFSGSSLAGSSFSPPPIEEEEQEVEPEPVVAEAIEPEHKHEDRPAGEADVVFLAGMDSPMRTPSLPEMPDFPGSMLPPAASSESLSLDELSIPLPSMDAPPPLVAESPSEPILKLPDIDLEALLGSAPPPSARIEDIAPPTGIDLEETKTAVRPPTPAVAPAPGAISGFEATTQLPAVAPPGAVASVGAATPGSSNGLYYQQNFDDEPVGKQPNNWQGEYDYATLTVDNTAPANGSAQCLRFEKRTGAGSANYICTFPKASGRVLIEFDMRCDEKNKYLLGFYIEKDEDFKQSVHTIIHRTDSKSQPSLRIQGEPIPYQLGTWRHIKYDLNLMAGIVNAWVDDQPVVKDGKLPSNPAYVNTLSIRDNLATTGLLFLDNIKIYKA